MRIWAAQVIVDHFNDLNYAHLTRRTIQEDTLAVKEYVERWATTFGVKINRYHADNGGFSEQPFISAI